MAKQTKYVHTLHTQSVATMETENQTRRKPKYRQILTLDSHMLIHIYIYMCGER